MNTTARKKISIIVIMTLIVSMMGVMPFAKVVKPAKVTGLKATTNAKYTITFKWKKAKRATSYKLYVKEGSGKYQFWCQTPKLKATFYSNEPGTKYSFKVKAYNKKKAGKISAVKSIRTYSKVKFVMKDKTVTKAIKYGANVVAPSVSDYKSGSTTYTFSKWDKSLNAIKGNTTITAIYKVKNGSSGSTSTNNASSGKVSGYTDKTKNVTTGNKYKNDQDGGSSGDNSNSTNTSNTAFNVTECLNAINAERAKLGLNALAIDATASKSAAEKAKLIYEEGNINEDPHYVGGKPYTFYVNRGITNYANEVVHFHEDGDTFSNKECKGKCAADGWRNSTGHWAALSGNAITKIGLGCYKGVVVGVTLY